MSALGPFPLPPTDWTEIVGLGPDERLDAMLAWSPNRGADLAELVRATLFVLNISRPSKGRDRLRAHLEQARQLVTVIHAGPPVMPDASSVEALIATSLDGVIEVPREGRSDIYLDARLRRVHRL